MKKIATVYTPFDEKFGIPRQSGRVSVEGEIVFEPEYSRIEAFKGLEGFSHVWVLWEFSENVGKDWSPCVRPPRLGGNKKVGVFATRSPFRPNPIGMSCVKLKEISMRDDRIILRVDGVDMLNGTPVYDVKPYVPYTDSHSDAIGGFSEDVKNYSLKVDFDEEVFNSVDENLKREIIEILSDDPRPSYQNDDRIYGMKYSGREIKFVVQGDTLSILSID